MKTVTPTGCGTGPPVEAVRWPGATRESGRRLPYSYSQVWPRPKTQGRHWPACTHVGVGGISVGYEASTNVDVSILDIVGFEGDVQG